MKSIAIVSLDDLKSKMFAKQLAQQLSFRFIDLAVEFDKVLLLSAKASVLETEYLEQKEKQIIDHCAQMENVVFSIDNNMFLSNANYELCKNMQVVLLEQKKLDKFNKNLQNLLKKHANFSVFEKKFKELITLLKG